MDLYNVLYKVKLHIALTAMAQDDLQRLLAHDADAKLKDYLRAYNASGALVGGLPPGMLLHSLPESFAHVALTKAVRQSISFTPKQVEAWSRVFPRSDKDSDEWSWDIEAAAKQMDIKPTSVLNVSCCSCDFAEL